MSDHAIIAGDLRMVRALEKRVAAAVSQGFRRVIVPKGAAAQMPAVLAKSVVEVENVKHLKNLLKARQAGRTGSSE